MARYQFFSVPASRRQQYTYVDMASPTFLTEKEALLTQGFEVEEDFIDAATPHEAVEKYRSGFLYVADEIGKSDEAYAAATALLEMGKKILIISIQSIWIPISGSKHSRRRRTKTGISRTCSMSSRLTDPKNAPLLMPNRTIKHWLATRRCCFACLTKRCIGTCRKVMKTTQ